MNIVLIGGMDRLERHYMEEAEDCGVRLKVFTKSETGLSSKIGSAEAMILFTNKVSHRVRNEALNMAKARNIPVQMCHSCGVCSLRTCLLNCLNPQ
ncbi:DUF2325 domain-containing protein [Geobacter hydrogenophilus]|uniref:DUF2325 domain-containing protein n=1 Tax=Geobacter hydrogenophilus TaxID=40983 RepID=A0A9W6G217_9BACT|nr:DUF2325 domain-containing protein [Geobacter hydrogenophilus]MBT0894404.1 DUF2325 domain-containing protein [Geobacter hydrogenophilus]GLI39440.1 hypothetical protein GHYDROH2_29410 [Geobacter hydrogenophilus]